MQKGCAGRFEIVIPQFLAIEPHFVPQGCAGRLGNRNFTQFFAIEPHFVRKGLRDNLEIAILLQFLAIEPNFVRNGSRDKRDDLKSQFYFIFWRSNLISCERVAFRAVSLALPRAFKREIEKKERARGQEEKM